MEESLLADSNRNEWKPAPDELIKYILSSTKTKSIKYILKKVISKENASEKAGGIKRSDKHEAMIRKETGKQISKSTHTFSVLNNHAV